MLVEKKIGQVSQPYAMICVRRLWLGAHLREFKKETVLINYFRIRKKGIDYRFNVKTTPAQLAVRRKEKT